MKLAEFRFGTHIGALGIYVLAVKLRYILAVKLRYVLAVELRYILLSWQ